MINTPSISKKEKKVSLLIENYIQKYGFYVNRKFNNIWVENSNYYENNKKNRIILLNSHCDTVLPGKNWDINPFKAKKINDKILGLGSNDAGASVVSMISSFIYLSNLPRLSYKLILSITAEEEISGSFGIKSILPEIGYIDLGIVGEPTEMKAAIAEKGLLILDCISKGETAHSAYCDSGKNAIYIATKDIEKLRKKNIFKKKSKLLGNTILNVTQIQGGIQHNVIPDSCYFVLDIRTNDLYKNEEIIKIIQKNITSKVHPRYTRSNYFSTNIKKHPIVKKAKSIGIKIYGSPTLSDKSLMDFPSIKMGVGNSSRSHTPNEYILISEIFEGIDIYIQLLENFNF